MPTVRWLPRCVEHKYYYRCLENFFYIKKSGKARGCNYGSKWPQMLVLLRKRRTGGHDPSFRRKRMFCIIACTLGIVSLQKEITRKRVTVFYPSQEMQIFYDAMFDKMFRFRRADFYRMVSAMRLSGKSIRCGRKGKAQYFPADICLLVVLRRLAYPCRFVDLVNVFGLPSNRICDIFHTTIDYLYASYARKLNQYAIWSDHLPIFAQAMKEMGAPYNNLCNIFDGHFVAFCRPGELGNSTSRLDQSEVYTGEKAQHGMKYLAAQFPNGMTSISGPYKGRTHDGRMLRESGWIEHLARIAAQPGGLHLVMFGDACFCVLDHVQAMIKSYAGYIQEDARSLNNLMSRIRLYIENTFAESAKPFAHLNYKNGLRLGGRRVHRIYEVANFLMNVRTTFYGNQFTCALRHRVLTSVEEFLAMAQT